METYDLIVIGMTYAGAGAAVAFGGSSLVLEPKALPGYEFTGCMRPFNGSGKVYDGLTATLKDRFEAAGLFERPFTSGWTPYFSGFLLDRNCQVQFYTDVIGVERRGDLFCLTLCQNGEKKSVLARAVLDTRTAAPVETVLHGGVFSEKPLSDFDGFSFTPCGKGVYIASLPADRTDCPDFRRIFFERWQARPGPYRDARILNIADFFACRSGYDRKTLENGVISLPSDFSANLFEAFHRGVLVGEELK